MQVELAKIPRCPVWPMWAVALVLTWLALGGLTIWLGAFVGQPLQLCVFKGLMGLPCPTCGLTRGTLCLLHGEPIAAWLHNPFLFSFLGTFFLATMVRTIFGRRLRVQLTGPERMMVWALIAATFLANWLYVIVYVG